MFNFLFLLPGSSPILGNPFPRMPRDAPLPLLAAFSPGAHKAKALPGFPPTQLAPAPHRVRGIQCLHF